MILDIMRREKKLVLGLFLAPLILGLVAYLIPTGGVWGTGISESVLAKVGNAEVSTAAFTNAYQRFLRSNRIPLDRQFLKTLQIDQQILNQLISRELILSEAKRLGIDATANEIQQRILSMPYFLDNGNFLFNRYEAILRQNGMTVQEFEDGIRIDIIQEKLRNLITDSVMVSEKTLEDEYRTKNEKVKVNYVAFEPAMFTDSVTPTEPDLKTYFDKNKETYRVPEQRKISYLFIDAGKIRNSLRISDAEMKNYYEQNLQSFQLPERVRAAHILFKTEGKSPEEAEKIKAKATEILARVKKGEDFAALAKKYSEDGGSASQGGDLGFFGRGQMVPEFENAAFTLKEGTVSDLVTTKYGFHIIKVLERQSARTQTFDEVASTIRLTLLQKKADQAAQELADKAYSRIRNNQTVEQVSKDLNLPIEATGFFTQGASIAGIGNSQELSSKVFDMKLKEIGSPVRVPNGFIIPRLLEKKAPYLPELSEVRSKVEQDFRASKAIEIAKSKAQEFANKAKGRGDFETLAKKYGATPKASEDFTRNGNIPDLGSSAPLDSFAFSANPGDVSSPIQIGQKQVVVQLKEKTSIKPEDLAKAKDTLRDSLLAQKKEQVFQAYLDEVKDKMIKAGKIKVNETLFADISRRM
jgi:peptidyl-prolyl cis-trans isomerase D